MILRGGLVVDGTGAPGLPADVVVADGRIERLLQPGAAAEGDVVDITGLVVAPGFIDMHAHSDLAVLADADHSSKLAQGVTLDVVGQDGLGYSPVTDESMQLVRTQIAGWNGEPALDYSWRSVADYLALVDRGAPLNVAALIPHGTVRMSVLGVDAREPTAVELDRMREIIAQGMRDGAMGLSTGLSYPPAMFATDDELAELLTVVRDFGGYYCPHHRNYGTRVIESYRECLDLAEQVGVALHLAHCHVNFPINRGRAAEVLDSIDAALERGVDVTLDAYPYLASATYLASFLPKEAHIGGPEHTMALLRDPVRSQELRRVVEEVGSDGNHGVPVDWATVTISSTSTGAAGQRVSELAQQQGVDAWSVVVHLLLDDQLATGCVLAVGNEENMLAIMTSRAHTVGTDGILVGDKPHPRGWGSFPKFLGAYARDRGMMSLEDAVHHVTGRPARRLGLSDRGTIAEGNWADLVVFDAATIASPATYDEPKLPPTGIRLVLVNGAVAMDNGVRTSALAGRAVRSIQKERAK